MVHFQLRTRSEKRGEISRDRLGPGPPRPGCRVRTSARCTSARGTSARRTSTRRTRLAPRARAGAMLVSPAGFPCPAKLVLLSHGPKVREE